MSLQDIFTRLDQLCSIQTPNGSFRLRLASRVSRISNIIASPDPVVSSGSVADAPFRLLTHGAAGSFRFLAIIETLVCSSLVHCVHSCSGGASVLANDASHAVPLLSTVSAIFMPRFLQMRLFCSFGLVEWQAIPPLPRTYPSPIDATTKKYLDIIATGLRRTGIMFILSDFSVFSVVPSLFGRSSVDLSHHRARSAIICLS
jgi:hypothetical protein